MSLSFVLDVVIGLIFIYLILSLLASEIQELLTTLLQWRAAHLKKSIEILLTGGEGTANDEKVKNIVKDLYDNPLIKNISQESKEGIEAWLRQASRFFVTLGRDKNLTLKGNEPSYIPSETFASTLLERFNISQFSQKMTALNLQRMIKEEIVDKIKSYINDDNLRVSNETRQVLTSNFEIIIREISGIQADFGDGKATLLTSVNRLRDEIDSFIETSNLLAPSILSASRERDSNEQKNKPLGSQGQAPTEQKGEPEVIKFITQLKSLKNGIFPQGNRNYNNTIYNNTDEVIRRLQPSLAQILDLAIGEVKNEKEEVVRISETYKSLKEQFGNLDQNDEIYKAYKDITFDIEAIGQSLPLSVRESFAALARRAQINLRRAQSQVQAVEDEIYQFKTEVQVWFDRSMDRASGVYKRNAKGIAFLIGFLLAFAVNADTFHITSRLTTDSVLRDAFAKNAEIVTKDCLPTQGNTGTNQGNTRNTQQLECIRKQVNQSIPLPIGRDEANLNQQAEESKGWFWPPLRSFLGWIVSGFAIMMGAPFWFELLGKIVNVRNAGKPPETSTDRQATNQSVPPSGSSS